MHTGTTKQDSKVWDKTGTGRAQVSLIPKSAPVTGSAPSGGYVYVYAGSHAGKSWKAGFTREEWLANYKPAVVTPPPPDPEPVEALPDTLWIGATKETVQEYKRAA